MSCLVCREQKETTGVACAECLEELALKIAITPEQVSMQSRAPTPAALVDPWGRLLRIHKKTTVGREHDDDGLRILDATISRRHAVIEQRPEGFVLKDLGSSNGTFVENTNLASTHLLKDGERIRFGELAFIFLDEVGAAPQVDPGALAGYTVKSSSIPQTKEIPRIAEVRDRVIELREPTGGGGGVMIIDGKPIQLTLPQYELVTILHNANAFVHPTELIRSLSLDSAEPSEDHVRQLVRRMRRIFFKAGFENVIESRYGAGYRLRLRTM